jgi:histidinol phosphatase-like enzyme
MTSGKALFLDRDGVINVDCGYVHRREKLVFIDGVFELSRRAQERVSRIRCDESGRHRAGFIHREGFSRTHDVDV